MKTRKSERTGLRKPVYVTQQRTASYPTDAWAQYHPFCDYGWRLARTSSDVLALRMGTSETIPLSVRQSLATCVVSIRNHCLHLALVAPATRILSSSWIRANGEVLRVAGRCVFSLVCSGWGFRKPMGAAEKCRFPRDSWSSFRC